MPDAPASSAADSADNVDLARSRRQVDAINADFYRRFPYPWPPMQMVRFAEPDFGRRMLNQDLGAYDFSRVGPAPDVWVAGCGTNQAAITALRFPQSRVIGSDLSSESLDICRHTADQVGVDNLELRCESINRADYRERFDHVLCTGVIHHNYDPREPLARLAAALRPAGVLELMVYNRFHWSRPASFQRAVRFLGGAGEPDFEDELRLARKLLPEVPDDSSLGEFLQPYADCHPSKFADVLLQPVLHSATVESFHTLCAEAGLELLVPRVSLFDTAADHLPWCLRLADDELRERWENLPDVERWMLANLVLQEQVPYVWFYLQRSDCAVPRPSEREICSRFLDTVFEPTAVDAQLHLRRDDGGYDAQAPRPFPPAPAAQLPRRVHAAVDGRRPMRRVLDELRIDTGFTTVNDLRLRLTTEVFPHLQARL